MHEGNFSTEYRITAKERRMSGDGTFYICINIFLFLLGRMTCDMKLDFANIRLIHWVVYSFYFDSP